MARRTSATSRGGYPASRPASPSTRTPTRRAPRPRWWREKKVAGAGSDVYTDGPLQLERNPFTGLDNVVLTPHVGAVTHEAAARSRAMPVDNIIAFLEGRPEHVVV